MNAAFCRGRSLLVLSLLLAGCTSDVVASDTAETSNTSVTVTATTLPSSTSMPDGEGNVVVNVVDGDTIDIDIDGTIERVRFIGINTPERGECFYDEATEALIEMIGGRAVDLEVDTSDRDRNGRLLRYVFVDGEHVNEMLVRGGFAIAQRFPPDTARTEELETAQVAAQEDGAGLWAEDACGVSVGDVGLVISEIEFDAPGDDGLNLNGEWVTLRNDGADAIDLTGWVLKDESASHRFGFPDGFALESDAKVQVFSGCGDNTDDELFWCTTGSAIWNNSGDTVFVLDPNGSIVVSESY